MDLILQQYFKDTAIPQEKRLKVSKLLSSGQLSNEKLKQVIKEKYGNKYNTQAATEIGGQIMGGVVQAKQAVKTGLDVLGGAFDKRIEKQNQLKTEEKGIGMTPGLNMAYGLTGGDEGVFGKGGTLGFVTEPSRQLGRTIGTAQEEAKKGVAGLGKAFEGIAQGDVRKAIVGGSEAFQGGSGALLSPVTEAVSTGIKALPTGAQEAIAGTVKGVENSIEDSIRAINPQISDERMGEAKNVLASLFDTVSFGAGKALKAPAKAAVKSAVNKLDDVFGGLVKTQKSKFIDELVNKFPNQIGQNVDNVVKQSDDIASSTSKVVDDVQLKNIISQPEPRNIKLDKLKRAGVKGEYANKLATLSPDKQKLVSNLIEVGRKNYLDRTGAPSVFDEVSKPVVNFIDKIAAKRKEIGAKIGVIKDEIATKPIEASVLGQVDNQIKTVLQKYRAYDGTNYDFEFSDLADSTEVQKLLNKFNTLKDKTAEGAQKTNLGQLDSLSKQAGGLAEKLKKENPQAAKAMSDLKEAIDDPLMEIPELRPFKQDYSKIKKAESKLQKTIYTKSGNDYELDVNKFFEGLNQKNSKKFRSVEKALKDLQDLVGEKLPDNLRENAYLARIVEDLSGGTPAKGSMTGLVQAGSDKVVGAIEKQPGWIGTAVSLGKFIKERVGPVGDEVLEGLDKVQNILEDAAPKITIVEGAMRLPVDQAKKLFKSLGDIGIMTEKQIMNLPSEIKDGLMQVNTEILPTVVRQSLEQKE